LKTLSNYAPSLIDDMKEFLIVQKVREIADDPKGRCSCDENVNVTKKLCDHCIANELIIKYDTTFQMFKSAGE